MPPSIWTKSIIARVTIVDAFDTKAKAPRIGVPVLIAHGDRDTLIPIAMARELDSAFLQSEMHVLASAGHDDVWRARIDAFARGDASP